MNQRCPVLRRGLLPLILAVYGAWAVYSAAASGLLKWGALGDYSLFSYVLVLGLMSSGVVFMRARSSQVGGTFLLLFLAYAGALSEIRPMAEVPASMLWVFDFIACVTAGSVVAAATLFERDRREPCP